MQASCYHTAQRAALRTVAGFLVFVALDLLWFSVSAPLYARVVTRTSVLRTPAAVVWLLLGFAVGVRRHDGYASAIVHGLFVGLVVYGVFNGTNMAILQNWPLEVALADTAWGCVVCSAVAAVLHRALP